MFVLDIETLGVESTSVILSVALLHIDLSKPKHTWKDLYENTLFLKLNVRDQVENYNRTVDKDTIVWWNKQCDLAKNMSFIPKKGDLLAADIPAIMRKYAQEQAGDKNQETMVWIRGSIDQVCLDSLFVALGEPKLFPYANYRDVRTYVDFAASNPVRGYCGIDKEIYPEFDRNLVIKHDPISDVCLDALQLLYPE
jgi:hypothetical protein